MNRLVQKLATGTHPIVMGGPQPTLQEFHNRVREMGFVFIKFTDTLGGTSLGVRVDATATDLSRANFDDGIGIVHVEGTLTLDYVKVRCVADIDLPTLSGTGYLVALEEV